MPYDVIISGGGPVGLFLATELALRDIGVLVLEKTKERHAPIKAGWMGMRGLNAPSLVALDWRGLLDEVRDAALLWKENSTPDGDRENAKPSSGGHFATLPIQGDKIDALSDPFALRAPSVAISMESLEAIFERRAEQLGVLVRRGVEVTEIEQDEGGVTVRADGETFRGSWLVGCDGARSVVRKQGGFKFDGTEPQLTGYLASAVIADPEKLQSGFTLTPCGVYALGPGPERVVLMDFDEGTAHDGQEVSLDHFQSILRRISGTDVTVRELNYASTWTDRARQADTYRKGRILLAGDAAHIHSPLGAQGLNTGLADALNLGWKLAATIKGWAPAGLLDTYTRERHPAGAWALRWTLAQVAVMRPDPWGHAITEVMRDLIATHDGATYFADKIAGTSQHYDLGDGHPLCGRPFPAFKIKDGAQLKTFLKDGAGILLDFRGDQELCELASRYDGRLKMVSAQALDTKGIAALFIRPDGIVAWVWDGDTPLDRSTANSVISSWMGKTETA
ncbi:FAD-dependent monooxygenase [Consotaella aegiceratis]|uniref:FAD-dependent monooxygenase n=1 Tax=Consotaella aegiceratis TaxID=3097961 RepID=UPI002F4123EA